MKCPKCGYTSFEYLNVCKKCNKDLSLHKDTYCIVAEAQGTINILSYISLESEAIAEPEEVAEVDSVEKEVLVVSKEPETGISDFSHLEEISLDQIDEAYATQEEQAFSYQEETQLEVILDEEDSSPVQSLDLEENKELVNTGIEQKTEVELEELENVQFSFDEIGEQAELTEATAESVETSNENYLDLDAFEVLSDDELERASSQSFHIPNAAVPFVTDDSDVSLDEFDLSLELTDSFDSVKNKNRKEFFSDHTLPKSATSESENLDFSLDSFDVQSDSSPEAGIVSKKQSEKSQTVNENVEISFEEIALLSEDIKAEEVIDQIFNISDSVNGTGDDEKGIELSFENFKLETEFEEKPSTESETSLNMSDGDAKRGTDIVLETLDDASEHHGTIELFDQIDLAEHENRSESEDLLKDQEENEKMKKKMEKSNKKNTTVDDAVNINLEDLYPDLDSTSDDSLN